MVVYRKRKSSITFVFFILPLFQIVVFSPVCEELIGRELFFRLIVKDSGAAFLVMIASYFGKSLSIAEVRSVAGTDIIGTNMQGIMTAVSSYGLKARAVKLTFNALLGYFTDPLFRLVNMQNDIQESLIACERVWGDSGA
jgi:hypothetical protein